MKTSPYSWYSEADITFNNIDFPASLSPIIATRDPRSIPKLSPASIVLSLISLPTFFNVILASINEPHTMIDHSHYQLQLEQIMVMH